MIEISDTQNNVSSTKKWKRIYLIYLIAGALIIRDFFSDKSGKSTSLIIFTIKLHGYPFL
jgi:hypothetical protein